MAMILSFILLVLVLTPHASEAANISSSASCAVIFSTAGQEAPSHFWLASDFNQRPVSPKAMKRQGLIVVTKLLQQALLRDKPATLRASVVLDLQKRSEAQFSASLYKHYGLNAVFTGSSTDGLQKTEIVGAPDDILRFLNNSYAKKSVMWAGKTGGDRYLARASMLPESNDLGHTNTSGNLSFLEPIQNYPVDRERRRSFNDGIDRQTSDQVGATFNEGHATSNSGPPIF